MTSCASLACAPARTGCASMPLSTVPLRWCCLTVKYQVYILTRQSRKIVWVLQYSPYIMMAPARLSVAMAFQRSQVLRARRCARLHARFHHLRRARTRCAQVKKLRGGARHRSQALRTARDPATRSPTPRTSCSMPRPTGSRWGASSSRPPPTSTRSTSSGCTRQTRSTSTTCCLLVNLFELFEGMRDRYRRAFRHVLVDEFQDTNHAQYRCCAAREGTEPVRGGRRRPGDLPLARGRRADLLEFERDFPDAQVVKLEQNYRSTGRS